MPIHDPSSQAYKKARRQHVKTTRNRDAVVDLAWTPFRAAEKRYKARFPPPDLSQVLDLATLDDSRVDEIDRVDWYGRHDAVQVENLVSQHASQSKVYTVPRIPGLVLLPSFVSPEEQRELIQWALRDQSRYPNDTNLDIHYEMPYEGLWNAYLHAREDPNTEAFIQPRSAQAHTLNSHDDSGPRKLIDNVPIDQNNILVLSSTRKDPARPSVTAQAASPAALVPKLRWANIGWSYHWGSKQYDFTKSRGFVVPRVRELCRRAVATVPWDAVFRQTDVSAWGEEGPAWMAWNDIYEPDAGIVNFYQTKDTLMAHVDRSEVCATSPLVSISLGNAAIFLIGGVTRDVEPVAILLRSGDAVIMSGPGCRRAFHGVPRILENTLPSHLGVDSDSAWEPYGTYMQNARININARQVFPKGFDPCIVVSA